jgi:hypothetical protein
MRETGPEAVVGKPQALPGLFFPKSRSFFGG